MRLTPKELARALYLAAKDAPEKEAAERVARFVAAVRAQGGESALPAVVEALPSAVDAVEGIEEVVIESAYDLSDQTEAELLRLAGIDPKRAAVRHKTVPELIAGARVRRQDTVIDSSARRTFARIQAGARSSGNE